MHNYVGHALNVVKNEIAGETCNDASSSSELSIQNAILESIETRREEHTIQILLNNVKIKKP